MNNSINNKRDYQGALTSLAVAMVLASPVSLVSAQTSERGRSSLLEEVVVTAQRREESMQMVPIAINAFSGTALSAAGINSAESLQLVTPGLTYYRASSSASPFIRGMGGITTAVGSEASVATYVDGIYLRDMTSVNQPFNNVERVEVLKGPQGTLFGRNSTGGLIQTVTKTPGQESEAILSLKAGKFDIIEGDFYGSTAISDKVAADIAIAARTQGEGAGRNRTLGIDSGYEEYTSIRTKWVINATDATDVTLTYSWSETETDFGFNKACDPRYYCLAPVSPNFADTYADHRPYKDADSWLAAMHIDHRFDKVNFRSITSYQESDAELSNDVDGSAQLGTNFDLYQHSETFSQEFQFSSSYESDLQWIAGLFYWDDKAWLDPNSRVATGSGFVANFESAVETQSIAAYGQVYYNATDKTQITLGTRYTYDDKELTATTITGNHYIPADFEEWTFRVAVDHHFNEDIMGYISYNRGFRAGGFNGTVTVNPDPPLAPELVDAYAIGMKGDFLDGRLRVNSEMYFNKIKDTHYRAYLPGSTALAYLNAAAGEVFGLEITGTTAITDNLTLQIGYSYMDSEYTSFPGCPTFANVPNRGNGTPGNIITRGDCEGNEMVNTPENTVNLVLDYSIPLAAGRIDTSLIYYYNSGYWVGADETYDQPSYDFINASTNWVSDNEKYTIGLYGINLTNEKFGNGRDQTEFGNNVPVGNFPREYGISFKIRFL